MKVTIEITEEEIQAEVQNLVVRRVTDKIEKNLFVDQWGNPDRKVYREAIRAAVRDMMKPHINEIIARATEMAADQIEHKGLKKLLDDRLK